MQFGGLPWPPLPLLVAASLAACSNSQPSKGKPADSACMLAVLAAQELLSLPLIADLTVISSRSTHCCAAVVSSWLLAGVHGVPALARLVACC